MPSHLIIGHSDQTLPTAQSLAPFPLKSSPDCLILDQAGSLKIADVRLIKQFLTRKPYQNDHQLVYIPRADRLTIPAQNALLKTLEEPPAAAIIILTTDFPDRLLPTITSRCHLHRSESSADPDTDQTAFLPIYQTMSTQTIGQRMMFAQSYAYPKTKAITTCQNAIYFFRQQLHREKLKSAAQNAALAQKMLHYLESNCDPKLCLENFFLHLI